MTLTYSLLDNLHHCRKRSNNPGKVVMQDSTNLAVRKDRRQDQTRWGMMRCNQRRRYYCFRRLLHFCRSQFLWAEIIYGSWYHSLLIHQQLPKSRPSSWFYYPYKEVKGKKITVIVLFFSIWYYVVSYSFWFLLIYQIIHDSPHAAIIPFRYIYGAGT